MNYKNVKRIIVGVFACVCVANITIPTIADTVKFNITVGQKVNKDPLSKRTKKRDDEQKFYVTATAFGDIGSVRSTSVWKNTGKKSATITLKSSEIDRKKSGVYPASNAKAGEYYYLKSVWNSGPSELNVKGRYTP